ncbi:GTA-gp10 family protein [Methylosinus sp. Ce-a6]|uniref:GTA-gp10 family protein n=1 Tax=Methylosinus sp. Ce-a6 TaxID=2172005 RepID=UPI001359CCAC|nr:GTA-gp10 family protein [Methylosinus sp. Ce-a6]
MANRARGLVDFHLGDETLEIGLGLGALAKIEDAFGVESFEEALNFGERLSATKLMKFLAALVEGNGHELTPARRRAIDNMSPAEFMEALSEIMGRSGMSRIDAPEAEGPDAPLGAPAASRASTAGERG